MLTRLRIWNSKRSGNGGVGPGQTIGSTDPNSSGASTRPGLRLWPGVVAVIAQWLIRFAAPVIVPEFAGTAILVGLAGGLAVLVWWLFFSRAPWIERVGAVGLMVGALVGTRRIVHPSIANGMMGMMPVIFAIPFLSLALVAWAVASQRLHLCRGPRYAALLGGIVIACAAITLIRTDGLTGDAVSDIRWRWTKSHEERLLTQPIETPKAIAPRDAGTNIYAQWPGFRGSERDGIVRGTRLATSWSGSAPVEIWRRPVGPGWSSFAVVGDLIYTQEQRGEDEEVSCYSLATSAPVWAHRDAARFWESNAGAGPRGTPTVSKGRVYSLGATGILNALDARGGSVVWSRNAASDTGQKVPGWGFSSSPLVVGDVVIVATGGVLAAYDVATGNPRWLGPTNGWGYSSPHQVAIDGKMQIVQLNGAGAISVDAADGRVLWEHAWKSDGIVQPVMLPAGGILIGSGSGIGVKSGVRRIEVTHGTAGWTVQERWTTTGLKPYFNDFVAHKGHAYGFDGGFLACIELKEGKRMWKGGRYGAGQLVGLPDQDLLLVLSERGELALVKAVPDEFAELARFQAIQGKTWNHPVLVDDVLLLRNSQEMAAFRLPLAGR